MRREGARYGVHAVKSAGEDEEVVGRKGGEVGCVGVGIY